MGGSHGSARIVDREVVGCEEGIRGLQGRDPREAIASSPSGPPPCRDCAPRALSRAGNRPRRGAAGGGPVNGDCGNLPVHACGNLGVLLHCGGNVTCDGNDDLCTPLELDVVRYLLGSCCPARFLERAIMSSSCRFAP
jgi:hypothetical protein